jgi:hypothetical protein
MNRAKAVAELKETFSLLDADFKEVRLRAGEALLEFDVRATIRTFSALMEGLLYQMRQVAIHSDSDNIFYTPKELAILNEQTFSLNEKGEVTVKESHERALPMLLFTFKQYPKIHGATFSADTGVHGWDSMKNLIKIRNRIVHPKSKKDLQITQEEWKIINLGIDWFHETVKNMFETCDKADGYVRQHNKTP